MFAKLNEVGRITGGGTPKTTNSNYWGKGFTWITPSYMSSYTKFINNSKKNITEKGLKSSSAKLVEPNSIIISSRAPIGYVLINQKEVCTSQGCKSFTPLLKSTLNIEYVYYYLLAIIDDLKKRATGTTFAEISGSEFGETIILIPPVLEQLRIVNKIRVLENFI